MEGPPPGIDLSASQVPRILGVNIATFCLAVFAILLRFTARRLTRAAFWWDDWLMLPAIVICVTQVDNQGTDVGLALLCCHFLFVYDLL